ncbi:hypothetical protein [Achromobacter aloeverae]
MWDHNLDPFGRPMKKSNAGDSVADEDMQYLLQIMDSPITIHRAFVEVTGSLNAAAILSDLAVQSDRSRIAGDWHFADKDDWSHRLGLSYKEQLSARKLLEGKGLLETHREGIPPRTFVRVRWLAIDRAIRKHAEQAAIAARHRPTLN